LTSGLRSRVLERYCHCVAENLVCAAGFGGPFRLALDIFLFLLSSWSYDATEVVCFRYL
jgi:hypothetical protein